MAANEIGLSPTGKSSQDAIGQGVALVLLFRHYLHDFRLPELESVASFYNATLQYDPAQLNDECPYLDVVFPSIDKAISITRRCTLVSCLWQVCGRSKSYAEMNATLGPKFLSNLIGQESYKCVVDAFGMRVGHHGTLDRLEKLYPSMTDCQVDLVKPKHIFWIFENFGGPRGGGVLRELFFCRELAIGQGGKLATQYALPNRKYLGTTSMSAELSFLVANQAKAGPGTFILDPFVGTASILVSCAAFGAHVIGSDLDPKVVHGKGEGTIRDNFEQYGLQTRLVDLLVNDNSKPLWSRGGVFDAIVCDPPYGVRAGAKRVTNERTDEDSASKKAKLNFDATTQKSSRMEAYPMCDVITDLLMFSSRMLRMGGRLVLWVPTIGTKYDPKGIPDHPCLKPLSNSLEQLTRKYGRALVTMEKVLEYDPSRHAETWKASLTTSSYSDAHKDIRAKVFQSRSSSISSTSSSSSSSSTG